jgi:hypothetical protein
MFKIAIYIYSSLFDNHLSETDLYQLNKNNFVAIDEFQNGLILENVDQETIVAVINNHIGDRKINSGEEMFVFEGGVYLKYNDHIIVSQCCGDISNVENWRAIFEENNTYFKDLWIGHPWIFYKFDETKVYFTDYIEQHNSDELKIWFELDKNAFHELLKEKIDLFDQQKIRILDVIERNNFRDKEILKRQLFEI